MHTLVSLSTVDLVDEATFYTEEALEVTLVAYPKRRVLYNKVLVRGQPVDRAGKGIRHIPGEIVLPLRRDNHVTWALDDNINLQTSLP